MTRSRPIAFLTAAVASALIPTAIAVSAAGGMTPTPPATAAATARVTVDVATRRLGKILVDSHGRTLYLFRKDSSGKSRCSGACAAAWPPLLAHGKPGAGRDAKASLIGTTRRSNGTSQVTYHGHPLYTSRVTTSPAKRTARGWWRSAPDGSP
jgi:predicted lipoprotein with Yx(FWY)xxD motif